jgi:Uma2 family endonuclease
VVERYLGAPDHSALQKILVVQFAAFETQLQLAVRPECRARIQETRYRVPDVLVMLRPFRQNGRVVLDAPFLIIEILSPDDRLKDTMQRFREYDELGVRYTVQMDPEDRTTFAFVHGDLLRRDFTELEIPGHGALPFDSRELLARLDDE